MNLDDTESAAARDAFPRSPLFVVEVSEPDVELEGWLVVHSSIFGGASGGVRILPDVDRREVELLAEAMTCKYSFHRIRRGGAKCGIKLPLNLPDGERARRLRRFGEHLAPLIRSREFRPWTDMNCTPADLASILGGAGVAAVPAAGQSSGYTGLSTMAGVMAAAEHHELAPAECAISIEGFGSVGRELAAEIARWGGVLIGVSTVAGAVANPAGLDVDELLSASHSGDDWVRKPGRWENIPREELLALPMKIHVPCARVHSITPGVAGELACEAVVPAANAPCTPEARQALANRGVTLLPDFVTNSGGVLGPRFAHSGASAQAVRSFFLSDFKDMLARLLRAAEREHTSAVELAMRESRRNFNALWREDREPRRSPRKGFLAGRRSRRSRGRSRTGAEVEEILRFTQARFT